METEAGKGGAAGAFVETDPRDAWASRGRAAKAGVGKGFTATVTSEIRPPLVGGVVRAARV